MGSWFPLSLERRLALLMSGVLVAILATSLVLTYGTLLRSFEQNTRGRIAPAVRQVAASAEASMQQRARTMRTWSAEPVLHDVLARAIGTADAELAAGAHPPHGGLAAAALRGIAPHLTTGDTLTALRVVDRNGRIVLATGSAADPASERALSEQIERRRAGMDTPAIEGVSFGHMHQAGDRLFFWAVAPVPSSGSPLGYIAQLRRVGGPAGVQTQLRELIGDEVTLYLYNEGGTSWAAAPDSSVAPPQRLTQSARGLYHYRPEGRMIAEETVVAGTPWTMVLETPRSTVESRVFRTVARLSGLSLLLVVIGAALSWGIGRRIARPLASLTSAAEAIGGGDYAHRTGEMALRRDEVGKLSAMFDHMAEEVAASRRALEDQVTEAERAREQAERANRAKGDFLAVMSHELRTPLNAIGGYAQLLSLGVYGPLNQGQQDALARLSRSQAHLLRLIDEVLNLAKIDAGEATYRMDRVRVSELLEGLEPLVAPQMVAKGIRFNVMEADPALAVHADAEKLQQVLLNLLSNATKYTPLGGRVHVACDADDRHVRIHVADTGVGIPLERQGSIFERFVQGERSLNRPSEGVGLGLTISRDLARGMGGDLTVESEPGKGSVFTVRLNRFVEQTQQQLPSMTTDQAVV